MTSSALPRVTLQAIHQALNDLVTEDGGVLFGHQDPGYDGWEQDQDREWGIRWEHLTIRE